MLNSDYPDGQFIFKESEFEEETFAAASFVAKYRRVSSLESIKEQLQQYSNGLKQQLYNIINRDYKDFITISTKVVFCLSCFIGRFLFHTGRIIS